MTTTIFSTDIIGNGIQFTYAAANDEAIILEGVTVGSNTTAAISVGGFQDTGLTVLGTVVNTTQMMLLPGGRLIVGSQGSVVSFESSLGNTGLFVNGTGCLVRIDGSFTH
jgi:hypothetical protein